MRGDRTVGAIFPSNATAVRHHRGTEAQRGSHRGCRQCRKHAGKDGCPSWRISTAVFLYQPFWAHTFFSAVVRFRYSAYPSTRRPLFAAPKCSDDARSVGGARGREPAEYTR